MLYEVITDILTLVNGKATAGKTLDEVITYFSNDSTVPDEIVYLRDGVLTTVTVLRAEIHIIRVSSTILDGDIGYLRITEFNVV